MRLEFKIFYIVMFVLLSGTGMFFLISKKLERIFENGKYGRIIFGVILLISGILTFVTLVKKWSNPGATLWRSTF